MIVSPVTKSYIQYKNDQDKKAAVGLAGGAVVGGTAGAVYGSFKRPDVFEYAQEAQKLMTKEFANDSKGMHKLNQSVTILDRAEENVRTAKKRLRTLNKIKNAQNYPNQAKWLNKFAQKHENELVDFIKVKSSQGKEILTKASYKDEGVDLIIKLYEQRLNASQRIGKKALTVYNNALENALQMGEEIQKSLTAKRSNLRNFIVNSFQNRQAKKFALIGALLTGIGAGAAIHINNKNNEPALIPVPVPVSNFSKIV